jgi:FkbM family methyltransferase
MRKLILTKITNKILTFFGSNIFSLCEKNEALSLLYKKLYFLYKRFYEDPYYKLFLNYPNLLTGGIVVDVGANLGYNTRLFFTHIKNSKYKVISFEPDPHIYPHLVKTVAKRGMTTQVMCVNSALSNKVGLQKFEHNNKHIGDNKIIEEGRDTAISSPLIEVPTTTLDDFLKESHIVDPIRFVKIDVQGHELAVFEGMKDTIRSNPTMMITVEVCKETLEKKSNCVQFEKIVTESFNHIYEIHKNGTLAKISVEEINQGDYDYRNLLLTKAAVEKSK